MCLPIIKPVKKPVIEYPKPAVEYPKPVVEYPKPVVHYPKPAPLKEYPPPPPPTTPRPKIHHVPKVLFQSNPSLPLSLSSFPQPLLLTTSNHHSIMSDL